LENDGIYGYSDIYKIKPNCLTVTGRGKVGVAKARFCEFYPIVRLMVLQSEESRDFIFFENAINSIRLYDESTGVPQLTAPQLAKYRVSFPEYNEQQKIGEIFSILDRRIATQRKIIEDYKTVFSTAVAWSYNNCDWDEHRYGDLLKPYIIRNDRQDDYPILSASQSFGMIERDKLNIDIHAEDKSVQTYKMVCPGDYVLHLRSFQGGLAFSENRGICSPAYTIFRPTELLEYGFLREFFMSQTFIKSLRLVTYGIRDGRSINVDEFLDMKIRIPKLEEQKAIAKRLYTLRTKINIEESILMAFEKERQYLLSKMFI